MDFRLLLDIFPQVLLDGIILGFMYALIALGYTMVYGVLEFINFAHSEIFIVGAFVGVEILLGLRSAGVFEGLPWPFVLLLILVAGMAVAGALAVTVERIAYRPLRTAPRLIPLISAIGVSFFLQDLIRLIESVWRNEFNLVYPTMDVLNHRFELTQTLDVSVKSIVVIAAALLMLWVLHLLVNRTKIGTAIRAVAEDQAAASLMGINVNRIISLTFLIGGAMGGAAGVLFGVQYGLINPYSGFIPGLKAFTAAVLGGIGNIPGAMIGGIVLGLLEAFAASYLSLLTGGAFGAEYKDIFAFSVLILILIFRPKLRVCGELYREGTGRNRARDVGARNTDPRHQRAPRLADPSRAVRRHRRSERTVAQGDVRDHLRRRATHGHARRAAGVGSRCSNDRLTGGHRGHQPRAGHLSDAGVTGGPDEQRLLLYTVLEVLRGELLGLTRRQRRLAWADDDCFPAAHRCRRNWSNRFTVEQPSDATDTITARKQTIRLMIRPRWKIQYVIRPLPFGRKGIRTKSHNLG